MANFRGDIGFSELMRPKAERIYQRVFPGCKVENLRPDGDKDVHELDQYFGIDTQIILPSGGTLTVQEKYRRNEFLHTKKWRVDPSVPDFTQEYLNACGTEHERHGEWFHLSADLYFYGWASADLMGFEKWAILNVLKYKLLVESMGGLDSIGMYKRNRKHGAASFYAIPITTLKPAFMCTGSDIDEIKVWRTDNTGQVVFNKHAKDTGMPMFTRLEI